MMFFNRNTGQKSLPNYAPDSGGASGWRGRRQSRTDETGILIYTMVTKMNPPKTSTEGNAPRPSGKSGKSSAFLSSLRQACSSLTCCFRPSAKKSITNTSCPLTRTTPRRLLLQSRRAAVHPRLQRFFTRPEARIHPV